MLPGIEFWINEFIASLAASPDKKAVAIQDGKCERLLARHQYKSIERLCESEAKGG
jgi:hypothetical protein